jgi:enoyl-CoA hydratase
MILSGRTLDAVEAQQIGLVNELVEEASIASAKAYFGPILEFSQVALNLARSAVARAFDKSLQEGQAIETDLSTLAFQSEDSEEGMSAFLEKRKAIFNDA